MAGKSRSCGLTCFTGLRQIVSQLSNTIEIGHFFIAFFFIDREEDRPSFQALSQELGTAFYELKSVKGY